MIVNGIASLLQKARYDNAGVEEQLPPPPSPPQLKEAAQLDGVPRPNSVDRILLPDGTPHIGHEAHNKVSARMHFSALRRAFMKL